MTAIKTITAGIEIHQRRMKAIPKRALTAMAISRQNKNIPIVARTFMVLRILEGG